MGCSTHAVIQQQVKGKWVTVLADCFHFPSSMARDFNMDYDEFFSSVDSQDYITDPNGGFYIGKHYVGEHSLKQINLREFINMPVGPGGHFHKLSVTTTETGFYVNFEDTDCNVERALIALQKALPILIWDCDNGDYRLVIGFDS